MRVYNRTQMKKQTILLPFIILAIVTVSIGITAVLSMKRSPDPGNFHFPTSIPLWPRDPSQPAAPTEVPVINSSQSNNCTDIYEYWKIHPEKWPEQVQIGGGSIDRNQAATLLKAPSPDPIQDLERVLYDTQLNIAAGADPSAVQNTVVNANTWLKENQSSTLLSDFNRSIGDAYKQTLVDFNNGVIGPEPCPNQPATPTPAPDLQGAVGIPSTNPSGAAPAGKMMSYAIQPCDTLGSIAVFFHVKVASLLAANPNITNPNVISDGESIIIPAPDLPHDQSIWDGYDFYAYPPANGSIAGLPATGQQGSATGSSPTPLIPTSPVPIVTSVQNASSHCPAMPGAPSKLQREAAPLPTATPTPTPISPVPEPTTTPRK